MAQNSPNFLFSVCKIHTTPTYVVTPTYIENANIRSKPLSTYVVTSTNAVNCYQQM